MDEWLLVHGHASQHSYDVPAGSEARAISSIDAMRKEASTSLRGRAGVVPFFPFGIAVLHREITRYPRGEIVTGALESTLVTLDIPDAAPGMEHTAVLTEHHRKQNLGKQSTETLSGGSAHERSPPVRAAISRARGHTALPATRQYLVNKPEL